MDAVSYGDFCWNGECLNCQVWIKNGNKEIPVMSCRTDVVEGTEIVRVSEIGSELGSTISARHDFIHRTEALRQLTTFWP